MKVIKTTVTLAIGSLLTMQQVYAGGFFNGGGGGGGGSAGRDGVVDGDVVSVPEIDGSGAIIAIAMIGGLVALFREKFFRK